MNHRSLGMHTSAIFGRLMVATLMVCLLLGCNDSAGYLKLAQNGVTTANALANYYDTLRQDLLDAWEFEAFVSSLWGTHLTEEDSNNYRDQLVALGRRSAMARDLAATYQGLADMASSKSADDVSSAAQQLGNELGSLPPLKKTGVNPSELFGSLAGDLANWQRSRDLRKGNRLLLETLEKVEALFAREKVAYQSIAEERGEDAIVIVSHLIKNQMVVAWPLLDNVPKALDLTWAAPQKPPTDQATVDALVELAKVREHRLSQLDAKSADALDASLKALLKGQRDLQGSGKFDATEVLTAVQKAQAYLNEVTKLSGRTP